jgi:hypothetical protein
MVPNAKPSSDKQSTGGARNLRATAFAARSIA